MTSFNEYVAKAAFGITKAEAHRRGICISCLEKALPKCYSEEGLEEYRLSGICEACFDLIMRFA